MDRLIGKTLGPYQIVEKIGDGGMATVYKAFDPGTARHVALKVLSPLLAADPDFQGRFDQEARLVAQLQHSHILPIYHYDKQGDYTFIVMPLITSGTLASRLQGRPLPLPRTNEIVNHLASALDYAHNKHIIHRDLKPSNVLIDKTGRCFLTDFGIAKMAQSTAHYTRTGGIIGTPSYMSPEQGMGQTLDRRSDVYSLGIILYECVTGKVPFEAATPVATVMQHISSPLPSPKLFNPRLPDAVVAVIAKALAKQPEARFQSAGELAYALDTAVNRPDLLMAALGVTSLPTVIDSPPGMVSPGGLPLAAVSSPPPPAKANRPTWAWLAGLVVVLLLAVGGGYAIASFIRGETAAEVSPPSSGSEIVDNSGTGGGNEAGGENSGNQGGVQVVSNFEPTPEPADNTPEAVPPSDTPEPLPSNTPELPPTETPSPPPPTMMPTPEGPFGRIAFVSDRGGQDEIYLMDAHNPQEKRQITDTVGSDGRDWWPGWCGESNIVFERGDDPWQSDVQEIAMVDVNSGQVRMITSNTMPAGSTFNGLPSCSHDARTLAFSTYSSDQVINWAIGTIELDAGSPRFRTLKEDGYALAGNVSWSPDDQAVVFMHYVRDELSYHIYRVDLDDPYDFTDLSGAFGGNNKYPDWSPDGKWVAFTCGKTDGDDRRWSLCLTPSDFSRVEVVLPDIHSGPERWSDIQLVRHALTPNWSPDGKWLAFSANIDGDFDIYIYSPAEDELINLTNEWSSDEMHPSWGP